MLKRRFWPVGLVMCFIITELSVMIAFRFCHNGPPIVEVQDATYSSALAVTLFMIWATALASRIPLSFLIAIERKVDQYPVL